MACGTPAVASAIPSFREVGGGAAQYAAVGNVRQWIEVVFDLLGETRDPLLSAKRRQACVDQAKNFSWRKNAAQTVELYHDLLS
jgi:glycosyltransferase involved in cell wall biosynthesis